MTGNTLVTVRMGQATAVVSASGSINFSDILSEALGFTLWSLHNVVLMDEETQLRFECMFQVSEDGKMLFASIILDK